MERFKGCANVIYDANIIIYYCFQYKEYRISEFTGKARDLTKFLTDNGSKICVPEFIIDEINRKNIPKIVQEYVDNNHEIINLPKHPSSAFVLRLVKKIQNNFDKLQKKELF